MEPIDDLISPYGSHYPPNASTLAAMGAGSPQIMQIYEALLEETRKHTKPVTIYAAVNEEFLYNKETDTIYTTVDALGKHFDTTNARNTTIELYNPATGGHCSFTWRYTHNEPGPKSGMHHEYRAYHDGRWITLCVWFHSGKNVSA